MKPAGNYSKSRNKISFTRSQNWRSPRIQMSLFSVRKPDAGVPVTLEQPKRSSTSAQSPDLLSRGVSINGSVKFRNEMVIDGEVDGTIDSTGTLTIDQHGSVRGEIRAKTVTVRGAIEENVYETERGELEAGCTVGGDVEAPRSVAGEEGKNIDNRR